MALYEFDYYYYYKDEEEEFWCLESWHSTKTTSSRVVI